MLTLKLALSLDGRIATSTGESRWITGPAARRRVHLMRANHDAVLVGGGTARADDPELTVRDLGVTRQPLRLIASRGLDLPRGGRLEGSLGQGPLWLLHGASAPEEARAYWHDRGVRLVEVAEGGAGLDAAAMMARLGDEGLTRIFCEGGGALAASLMQARVVDRLEIFGAGLMLGADGRAGLGALGIGQLSQVERWQLAAFAQEGEDLWQSWQTPFEIGALARS